MSFRSTRRLPVIGRNAGTGPGATQAPAETGARATPASCPPGGGAAIHERRATRSVRR